MKNYIFIGAILLAVYLILTKGKGTGASSQNRKGMKINSSDSKYLSFVKIAEGYSSTPYKSKEGGSDTIGYGHKIQPEDKFTTITTDKATEILKNDVAKANAIVNKKLGSRSVTQREFNLLTDLAFNTGTIYDHVLKSLDEKRFIDHYKDVAITINGEFSQGLLNRRLKALQTL